MGRSTGLLGQYLAAVAAHKPGELPKLIATEYRTQADESPVDILQHQQICHLLTCPQGKRIRKSVSVFKTNFGDDYPLTIWVCFPVKDGAYELSALACGVYLGMLKQLPAMVRQWFNAAADKRTADEVESFTAKYVTPVLWAEEGESINGSKTAFDNMTVRTIGSTSVFC